MISAHTDPGHRPATCPPVDSIDGRPVTWTGWALCAWHRAVCDHCHHRGARWAAWGRVDPAPGEQFTEVRGRDTPSEREVLVAAWPIVRLVSYQCPTCRHRRIFDLKGGGRREVPIRSAEVRGK